MKACLAVGHDYIDLGGLYHVTAEQLKLQRELRAARVARAAGHGLLAGQDQRDGGRAVEQLGGECDRIDVTAGGRDLDPPDGFAPPYAVQTLLDELTLPPVVLRDGEAREIAPLTDAGVIDFPAPIGDAPAIYTLHSELLTFGESFGCSDCSFRLSLGPAVLDRLKELTTASPEEVAAAAASAVKPSAQTVSFHLIDAYSRRSPRARRLQDLTGPGGTRRQRRLDRRAGRGRRADARQGPDPGDRRASARGRRCRKTCSTSLPAGRACPRSCCSVRHRIARLDSFPRM